MMMFSLANRLRMRWQDKSRPKSKFCYELNELEYIFGSSSCYRVRSIKWLIAFLWWAKYGIILIDWDSWLSADGPPSMLSFFSPFSAIRSKEMNLNTRAIAMYEGKTSSLVSTHYILWRKESHGFES